MCFRLRIFEGWCHDWQAAIGISLRLGRGKDVLSCGIVLSRGKEELYPRFARNCRAQDPRVVFTCKQGRTESQDRVVLGIRRCQELLRGGKCGRKIFTARRPGFQLLAQQKHYTAAFRHAQRREYVSMPTAPASKVKDVETDRDSSCCFVTQALHELWRDQ